MFSFAAIVAMTVAGVSPPTCEFPVGMWSNQLGSTMIITSVDNVTRLVTGCYCSPSGTASEWFRLTGFVNSQPFLEGQNNANLISWVVQWGKFGSLTTWSGLCHEIPGSPSIDALWHLTRSNADQTWSHRLTDFDHFVPSGVSSCGPPPPSCVGL